jgi:hypothetical protein
MNEGGAMFRSILWAVSMLALSVTAGAEGPEPDAGEIAISLQQTVILELADKGGALEATVIEEKPAQGGYLLLQFLDDGDMRMLVVENHYDRTLNYVARMCMRKRRLCADTSVVPVAAGLSAFESWMDRIDLLVLSKFSLE